MNCVVQILIGIIESVDWQTLGIKNNIKYYFVRYQIGWCTDGSTKVCDTNTLFESCNSDRKWTLGKWH